MGGDSLYEEEEEELMLKKGKGNKRLEKERKEGKHGNRE